MMRNVLIPAALGLSFTAAAATAAENRFVVRADESPSDTRITIEVGSAPFMLEQSGQRQVDLVTPITDTPFDLSAIQPLTNARRVIGARVVEDGEMNRLRLLLGCHCAYGFAIIDGVLSLTFSAADLDEKPAATARSKGSPYAPARAPRPFARPSFGTEVAAAPPVSDKESEVLLARKHLLEQLSRAAEQGLLQLAEEDPAPADPISPPVAAAEPPPALVVTSAEPAEAPASTGKTERETEPDTHSLPSRPAPPIETAVRARTAIDKVFRPDRHETLVDIAPCLDAADVSLTTWRNSGEFLPQVTAYRRALLDEFDRARPEIVSDLARLYILNGFGIEAEALLNSFGTEVPDRAVLKDLARIIEQRPLGADGPIARTAPCNGAALMWRRIANLPRADARPPAEIWDELQDAFAALPPETRSLVAAPLLSHLVDDGELGEAETLLLILSRSPMEDTPALDLARARMLAAGGDVIAAEALYDRLATRDTPEAQESLIRLLDSLLARNAAVPRKLVNALSDLAFATRGQPLERAAKAAEIRALAAVDGPEFALSSIEEAIARSPEDTALLRDAGHDALERMEPRGDSNGGLEYAQAVMRYASWISTGKDGDAARRKAAGELIAVGLPNAGLTLLAPAIERRDRATLLVAAKALVSLDQPDSALEMLTEIEGPEVELLRATALARQGAYAEAARADPQNTDYAMRAGDWATAATGEGPRAALAAYMAADTHEERPNNPPTLSEARDAQGASAETRKLIEEALSDG